MLMEEVDYFCYITSLNYTIENELLNYFTEKFELNELFHWERMNISMSAAMILFIQQVRTD